MNKAIDYDQLGMGINASTVYWSRAVRSISAADLSALLRLTVKLIIDNPSPYPKGAGGSR